MDIVILSYAKDEYLKQLTENCLITLKNSIGSENFNIIVIESQKDVYYKEVATMHIDEPFNYNRFSNKAIQLGNSEWIGVFNNDVEFHKDWYIELMKYKFDSMSPKSLTSPLQSSFKINTLGYRTGRELSGWAIVMKREVWNKIGQLDESVSFWCSDDVYREQLLKQDIKHYIIPTSIVNHLENGSNTLKTVDRKTSKEMTWQQVEIFNKKWNRNLFG